MKRSTSLLALLPFVLSLASPARAEEEDVEERDGPQRPFALGLSAGILSVPGQVVTTFAPPVYTVTPPAGVPGAVHTAVPTSTLYSSFGLSAGYTFDIGIHAGARASAYVAGRTTVMGEIDGGYDFRFGRFVGRPFVAFGTPSSSGAERYLQAFPVALGAAARYQSDRLFLGADLRVWIHGFASAAPEFTLVNGIRF